jgi:hypothetical protein
MQLNFRILDDGTFVPLSDEEEIVNLLAEIKAALERKPVTDPKVWSGYPDDRDGDDEEYPHIDVGLFLNLERCMSRDHPSRGTLALAVDAAFQLGRASITGTADPATVERILAGMSRMAEGRKNGGLKTGPEKKGDAEDRHRAMKDVWRAHSDQYSGRDLAAKVCAGKFGVGLTDLSEERVRALFGQWKREAVEATERDTWAAGCWIASENGGEHHRYTHDKYRVLLFEENRRWRLRIKASTREEWTPKGSVESLDAAKVVSYAAVEKLRKHLEMRR